MLFAGYDFTGAINLKPSIDSFFVGKTPCQVFAFEFKMVGLSPHVKMALLFVPCAAASQNQLFFKRFTSN